MIWSIAWKNIWRNKSRSLVILIAIALGLMAGVFSVGLMMGMIEQRINNSIHNELAHLQVHDPTFLQNEEINLTIKNPRKVKKYLKGLPEVESISSRLKINGMANTSSGNTGVTIYGVNPEQEKKVFDLHGNVIKETGSYLDGEPGNKIVIGEKLAENLNIIRYKITGESISKLEKEDVPAEILGPLDTLKGKLFRGEDDFKEAIEEIIGEKKTKKFLAIIKSASKNYKTRSKIVLTMQDKEGNLTGGAFRIAGIYSISNTGYEARYVFVHHSDLARITNLDKNDTHEMAVLLKEKDMAPGVQEKLEEKFPDHSIRLWKNIQPDLAMTTEYVEISYYIIIVFILLALGFGIVNTMLMAVLERIKELGMLMAIGMNKLRVFMMILLETVYLTLTGAVVGMLFGYILILITANTGIDLTAYAEGFQALGYSAVIFPQINMKFFLGVTGMVVATGIVSSVYPAIKALKLNPVEATRTE